MSVKKNADGVDPFAGADPLLVSYIEVVKDSKGKERTVVGERRLTPEEAWPESESTE